MVAGREKEKALLQAKLAQLERKLAQQEEDEARLERLEKQIQTDGIEREIRLAELERKLASPMPSYTSISPAQLAGFRSTEDSCEESDEGSEASDEELVATTKECERCGVQMSASTAGGRCPKCAPPADHQQAEEEEVEDFVTEGARRQIEEESIELQLSTPDVCACDCGASFETPGELHEHMQRCAVSKAQSAKRAGLVQPCAACGAVPEKVWWCSQCKVVPYCSRQCQKAAWREHKDDCMLVEPDGAKKEEAQPQDAAELLERLEQLEELMESRNDDAAWAEAFMKMSFEERYAVLTCGKPDERREVLSHMTSEERAAVFTKMKDNDQAAVLNVPDEDEEEVEAPPPAPPPAQSFDQQTYYDKFEGMNLMSISELVMLGDLHLWKVKHAPRVAVRSASSTKASIVGSRAAGRLVLAVGRKGKEVENGWIKLHKLEKQNNTVRESGGFMLVDGTDMGLGVLVEREVDSMSSLLEWPVYIEMRKAAGLDEQPSEDLDLMLAAREGLPDMLRKCIELVPERISTWLGEFGSTALHLAAFHGHGDCVDILLEAGADTTVTNQFLWTPLHCAAGAPMHLLSPGHTSALRSLIRAKADVHARDKDSRCPIQNCSEFDRPGMLMDLLAAKADVNSAYADPKCRGFRELGLRPPLVGASETGNVGAVKVLLAAKADVDATNDKGETAYQRADKRGRDEVVDILIAAGCCVEKIPKSAAEMEFEAATAANPTAHTATAANPSTTSNNETCKKDATEDDITEVPGVH